LSSRRRHTRSKRDWSSDVCSSDLSGRAGGCGRRKGEQKRMTGGPMEIRIGDITLPHRAVFGPMAGFTDAPCRRLMAAHGAGFTVSEMVSSRALTYGDHQTLSLLRPA